MGLRALELSRRLVQSGVEDSELLERCAQLLEQDDDRALAAECWSRRAARMLAEQRASEALSEVDRALRLEPEKAQLYLLLGLIYEQLMEVERSAAAFNQAEALVGEDADILAQILILRARTGRPDEQAVCRLIDLLESRPRSRTQALERSAAAAAESPYNPHLRYLRGVLLAHDGQAVEGAAELRIAIERYSVQSDRASELEARLALQQLEPDDEPNHRRVAALHFERGEVHQAMQALANLARVTRGPTARGAARNGRAAHPRRSS
jgi:Flp pilus assembly protein TadD